MKINIPGQSSTVHIVGGENKGAVVPVQTGKGLPAATFPMALRAVDNLSEIGTATSAKELVTLLNGNAGYSAFGNYYESEPGYVHCAGATRPARINCYSHLGVRYSNTKAADWTSSIPAETALTGESGLRIVTTNAATVKYITLSGYGSTLLAHFKISFTLKSNVVGNGFGFGILDTSLVGGKRNLDIYWDTRNAGNFSVAEAGVSKTATSGSAFPLPAGESATISYEIIGMRRIITVTKGANVITWDWTTQLVSYTYGFKLGTPMLYMVTGDYEVSNYSMYSAVYKHADDIAIGDSQTVGKDAVTQDQSWFNLLTAGRPMTRYAAGSIGIVDLKGQLSELQAIAPRRAWVMGSLTDITDPVYGVMATFQANYNTLINGLKAIPQLTAIKHLATLPYNDADPRPYNNWKASTFTSGVDQYIADCWSVFLQSGTDHNLNTAYESSGGHLNPTGQTLFKNTIQPYF